MKLNPFDLSKTLEYFCNTNLKLSSNDFKILTFMLIQKEDFFVNRAILSKKSNIHETNVSRSLKKLVRLGIICIENESKFGSKIYKINTSFVKKANNYNIQKYSDSNKNFLLKKYEKAISEANSVEEIKKIKEIFGKKMKKTNSFDELH